VKLRKICGLIDKSAVEKHGAARRARHAWMMAALAQGVHRIGASRMGIYSSRYEWGQVMGGLSGLTNYP
jgi:hypothetical protein